MLLTNTILRQNRTPTKMSSTTQLYDKASEGRSNNNAIQGEDDSTMKLITSPSFKDVELGRPGSPSSQDSASTNISQVTALREWLSVKAALNGKVISAVSLYGCCSVSMVLVNKSLASR
jgi:hypothetical protein